MTQAITYPYCDTNADLEMAYNDIEDFSGYETLTGFSLVTGQTYTYSKQNCGYFGIVFEDSSRLTEKTSIATVEATASTWWYDSDNDILYVHCSNIADPDNHTITAGVDDWDALKTTCRNDAQEWVESLLDTRYPRPLPFAKNSYNSRMYDFDIRYSTALMTCVLIIRHRDPQNPIAEYLEKMVWNPGNDSGILWDHVHGRSAFSFETTKDDFNGRLENITLDASSTGRIYPAGRSDSEDHWVYRVKISTAGAVETAYFRISDDDGLTWSDPIQTSKNFIYLGNDIWVRFDGTFVLNDEWKIEVSGKIENMNSRIGSAQMEYEL